jgi:endonuclease/exonuclease/phosphatase family metal-dependent hydrolase
MRLRVVTWNVHRCIGSDRKYSPERVGDILASLKPDIVALQEIDSSLLAEGEINQLEAISGRVGMETLLGPTLQMGYGVFGNAILYRDSNQPLIASEEFDLSYRKFEPRGAIAATFRLQNGSTIRIVNTHLGLKYWERVYQVERLLRDHMWRNDTATVLLGDFNEWMPFSPNSIRLNRPFQPAPVLRTFPSQWPKLSLDRILVSGKLRAEHAVINTAPAKAASDHLPVVADLFF